MRESDNALLAAPFNLLLNVVRYASYTPHQASTNYTPSGYTSEAPKHGKNLSLKPHDQLFEVIGNAQHGFAHLQALGGIHGGLIRQGR